MTRRLRIASGALAGVLALVQPRRARLVVARPRRLGGAPRDQLLHLGGVPGRKEDPEAQEVRRRGGQEKDAALVLRARPSRGTARRRRARDAARLDGRGDRQARTLTHVAHAAAAPMSAERAMSSYRTLPASKPLRFSASFPNVTSKDGRVLRARASGVVRARTKFFT